MSREWDRRAEHQGAIIVGMKRRLLLAIFIASIAVGAGVAWLIKTTVGL
jgi:hypothetical protein